VTDYLPRGNGTMGQNPGQDVRVPILALLGVATVYEVPVALLANVAEPWPASLTRRVNERPETLGECSPEAADRDSVSWWARQDSNLLRSASEAGRQGSRSVSYARNIHHRAGRRSSRTGIRAKKSACRLDIRSAGFKRLGSATGRMSFECVTH
jgi:hypothetical protein